MSIIIPVVATITCKKGDKDFDYCISTDLVSEDTDVEGIEDDLQTLLLESDEIVPIKDLSDSYEIKNIGIHRHEIKYLCSREEYIEGCGMCPDCWIESDLYKEGITKEELEEEGLTEDD